MTEATLLLVIIALCSLVGWMDFNNRKERKDLINRIVAKDTEELVNLELADKTKIEAKPEEEKQDLVPLAEMTNDEFDEHIVKGEENG
jgi:hypothetical protein